MRGPVFIWSQFCLFSYLSWFCLIYLGDYNKPGQFIFASSRLSFHRARFLQCGDGGGTVARCAALRWGCFLIGKSELGFEDRDAAVMAYV